MPPSVNIESIQTCCYENNPKRLLVGLTNNDLFADWEGTVKVAIGEVASAVELRGGTRLSTDQGIALRVPAGDVAILDVRLR